MAATINRGMQRVIKATAINPIAQFSSQEVFVDSSLVGGEVVRFCPITKVLKSISISIHSCYTFIIILQRVYLDADVNPV